MSDTTGDEQEVSALEIHVHPLYYDSEENSDEFRYNYDICLVKVDEMNLDGATKDVVCLPEQGQHVTPHWTTGPGFYRL